MGIDLARYHGWQGKLRSPWLGSLAIVRVGLVQVFRRRSYWIVLALGTMNFVLAGAIIYAVTQLSLPERAEERLFVMFGFQPHAAAGQESGYVRFMHRQSIVVMMLLAFAGSLLIGNDFRQNSLPFYLSRRIDRIHYITGKLLAISAIVSLLTIIPALLLFLEYGLFTSSLDYWISHGDIVASILVYGLVQCVVLSILLAALSAYLQRTAPIAITWASLFVLLGTISALLRDASANLHWKLMDPWYDIRLVGRLLFGTFLNETDETMAWQALVVLSSICLVSMILLIRKVRAVEIV